MPRDFLQPWAEPLVLYPFRFRDPLSGKWVRARYVAERQEIAARYAEWEITGAPEYRRLAGGAFTPWRANYGQRLVVGALNGLDKTIPQGNT